MARKKQVRYEEVPIWGAEGLLEDEMEDGPRTARQRRPIVEIIHVDDHIIVADKPAGIVAGVVGQIGESITTQLSQAIRVPQSAVRLVDRMVQGVSGVTILARTAEAQRELVRQFTRGGVAKTYLAIVRGSLLDRQGRIALDIGPDKTRPGRLRVGGSQARHAETAWTLKDQFAGFALLEVHPDKERGDQVRLHLQAAGMPLAVDPEYGGAEELLLSSFKPEYRRSRRREERPLISRLSLHARAITFTHPAGGGQMHFESPPPKDFRATINQLDKHGRIGVPDLSAGAP